MKYYLFAGSTYYAAGGARDFVESSCDLDSLIKKSKELLDSEDHWGLYEWYQITDENMRIINQSDEQAHC